MEAEESSNWSHDDKTYSTPKRNNKNEENFNENYDLTDPSKLKREIKRLKELIKDYEKNSSQREKVIQDLQTAFNNRRRYSNSNLTSIINGSPDLSSVLENNDHVSPSSDYWSQTAINEVETKTKIEYLEKEPKAFLGDSTESLITLKNNLNLLTLKINSNSNKLDLFELKFFYFSLFVIIVFFLLFLNLLITFFTLNFLIQNKFNGLNKKISNN